MPCCMKVQKYSESMKQNKTENFQVIPGRGSSNTHDRDSESAQLQKRLDSLLDPNTLQNKNVCIISLKCNITKTEKAYNSQ